MALVSGISATGVYSSVQAVNKTVASRGQRIPDNATFEEDLLQSGFNANVSTDDLLESVQSSIKSAINDPSNNGKDLFEVIQSAVQKTLEQNGVDTEKLTSLLQSQIPDQAGLDARTESSSSATNRPHGPPPAGGHRHGPPLPPPPPVDFGASSVVSDSDQDDSGTQTTTSSTASQSNSGTKSNSISADGVASQFKRLIADLIKSLPSGTTLDIKA